MDELICKWSKEDKCYVAGYKHFFGFGIRKARAWQELAIALAGVIEVMEEKNKFDSNGMYTTETLKNDN